MTELKPVSQAMRGLLGLLGETPAEHQASLLKKAKPAKPAKREKSEDQALAELRRSLNKDFLKRLDTEKTTAETIVEKFQPENLVAEAYVLFQRKLSCRNCGRKDTGLAHAQLFIRKRVRKDPANTKIYYPVNEISEPGLPRLVEISLATIPVCLHCFEEAACLEVTSPPQPAHQDLAARPSPEEDTASSGSMYLNMKPALEASSFSTSQPSSGHSTSPPIVDISTQTPYDIGAASRELHNLLTSLDSSKPESSESTEASAPAADTPTLTSSTQSSAALSTTTQVEVSDESRQAE